MRKGSFAVAGLALLAGAWVVGCGDDDGGLLQGDAGEVPSITGCNEVSYRGCSYEDIGCAVGVVSFNAELSEPAQNCEVSLHVECSAGCIAAVDVLDEPPPDTTDGGDDIPPVLAGASPFGGACDSDADCGSEFICLTADGDDWIGGGPGNGYCTLDCATDNTVCSQFPNSVCVGGLTEQEAYCFEGCVRGASAAVKCKNRPEIACLQVSDFGSACLPTCGSDTQCPEGRFCDIANGVCVADAPEGDPIGSACDPAAAVNTCQGFCMDFGDGFAVCSGLCTVGLDAPGCGIDPAVDEVVAGSPLCLPLLGELDEVGDTGLCMQRCDCNDNCLHAETVCDPFTTADVAEALGAQGLCLPPADVTTTGLSCELLPDAGFTPDSGLGDAGTPPDSGSPTDSGTPGPDSSVPPVQDAAVDASDAG